MTTALQITRKNNIVILAIISFLVLLVFGINNCLSYGYTLVIFSIINLLFPQKLRYYNFIGFEIYLFIAIIIFSFQLYNIPSYLGLSGPEGGIGTDDIRYFEKIVDVPIKVTSSATWVESYPFTDFLKVVFPFIITSPLNIIIFNILGACFIPSLTYLLAIELLKKSNIAKRAALIILLCPFLWSNALIIMRDGWTVSLTLWIYLLTIKKHYLLILFPISLLAFLRFGSVFFAIIGFLVILRHQIFNKSQKQILLFWILISIGILAFILSLNYLVEFSAGRIESSLFRETFIESLKRDDENGIITRIAQLPVLIRTPLLFIFFYFTPFFKIQFYTLGIFNLRFILDTLLTSIWLFICLKPIFKSIYIAFVSNYKLRIVVWISIFLALALSIISLQVRHKLVMMPILAILASYGMSKSKTKYDQLFTAISLLIIIFEILFSFR